MESGDHMMQSGGLKSNDGICWSNNEMCWSNKSFALLPVRESEARDPGGAFAPGFLVDDFLAGQRSLILGGLGGPWRPKNIKKERGPGHQKNTSPWCLKP